MYNKKTIIERSALAILIGCLSACATSNKIATTQQPAVELFPLNTTDLSNQSSISYRDYLVNRAISGSLPIGEEVAMIVNSLSHAGDAAVALEKFKIAGQASGLFTAADLGSIKSWTDAGAIAQKNLTKISKRSPAEARDFEIAVSKKILADANFAGRADLNAIKNLNDAEITRAATVKSKTGVSNAEANTIEAAVKQLDQQIARFKEIAGADNAKLAQFDEITNQAVEEIAVTGVNPVPVGQCNVVQTLSDASLKNYLTVVRWRGAATRSILRRAGVQSPADMTAQQHENARNCITAVTTSAWVKFGTRVLNVQGKDALDVVTLLTTNSTESIAMEALANTVHEGCALDSPEVNAALKKLSIDANGTVAVQTPEDAIKACKI